MRLADPIPPEVTAILNRVEIGYVTSGETVEANSDDNQATDVDLLPAPDLVITGVRLDPPAPKAGEPITTYVTVANQGPVPANRRWDGSGDGDWWLFAVSVYLKSTVAPPADVFDHEGEYCLAWPDTLDAGESQEFFCWPNQSVMTVPVAGTYYLYAQADVTWHGDGYWGQSFGLIRETLEDNNLFTPDPLEVGPATMNVYLPIVLRN